MQKYKQLDIFEEAKREIEAKHEHSITEKNKYIEDIQERISQNHYYDSGLSKVEDQNDLNTYLQEIRDIEKLKQSEIQETLGSLER